uniref:Copper resistance protein n=2 Tax=Escherichia coli TaxID=562 RepID=A0A2S0T0A5_ECOLX|nr:hypothetical protein [Escherichia coli]AWB15283.1 hypothetical protein [Escherichia coli]
MSIKNDGHYFCRAGGNRPDGLNEPVTLGVSNPPKSGWIERLIGTEVSDEQYERFLGHSTSKLHIPVENEHLFRFKMNADSGLRVHRFRTPQCTYSDVR